MQLVFLILAFLVAIVLPGCDIFCKDCNDPVSTQYQYINNTDKLITVVIFSALENDKVTKQEPPLLLDSLIFEPQDTKIFQGPTFTEGPGSDRQNAPFGLIDADSAVVFIGQKLEKIYTDYRRNASYKDPSNILQDFRYKSSTIDDNTTYTYTFGDYF